MASGVVSLFLSLATASSTRLWEELRVAGQRSWGDIAVSPDGRVIVAVTTDNGDLVLSRDGGEEWWHNDDASSLSRVAMTADGSKFFTVATGRFVKIWTDSGNSWYLNSVTKELVQAYWKAVAVSSNGQKIAVAVGGYNSFTGGNIWISSDSGNTWDEDTSVGIPQNWRGLAMSADGGKMVAVAQQGHIWTSTDGGDLWLQDTSVGTPQRWQDVAMSSDGSIMLAGAESIWISSNGGASWQQRALATYQQFYEFSGVAMSADGSKMAACKYGEIWTSMDSGNTWLLEASFDPNAYLDDPSVNSGWMDKVAMSSDGSQMLAVPSYNGYILRRGAYISTTRTTATNTTTATTKTTTIITTTIITTTLSTVTSATATTSTLQTVANGGRDGQGTTGAFEETSKASDVSTMALFVMGLIVAETVRD